MGAAAAWSVTSWLDAVGDGEFNAVQPRNPTIMASAAGDPGIGVGTWAWGNQFLWGYDPARDDDRLAATFRRCLERGLLFFDTADSYGTGRFNGRSESLLGRFAHDASPQERDCLTIATKLAPFPWRLGRQGYTRAFTASQARLQGQMKRVQLHWSTARYAPWQEGPCWMDWRIWCWAVRSRAWGSRTWGPSAYAGCMRNCRRVACLWPACRFSCRCSHRRRCKPGEWLRCARNSAWT